MFDGHGLNGHMVSDFCKRMIPMQLSNLINGGLLDSTTSYTHNPPAIGSSQQKKRKNKLSKHFLPPLVSQATKKEHQESE